jgi:hypothetical protein
MISCSPTLPAYETEIRGNSVQVPVSGFENSQINLITDEGAAFDIVLIKESQLAYNAFYLQCPYDRKSMDINAPSAQLTCPVCHSVYDYNGAVITGPSTSPLMRFPTELNPDQTLVRIDISVLGL